MAESNNKLLAKNTLMLYIRMFLVMGVGLYTSRIVLQALGESDFGIYSVVGGIVIMMSFLNNSLAGATQRFLSYELGKKDYDKLKDIFSVCFYNHLIVALAVVIIGETLGLWFVNTQLNIPEERMYAANVVYQFSLLTTCVNFIRIPYNAAIIANERMGIFSIISIAEVLLQVVLVFSLLKIEGDRLILYAGLLFVLSLVIQTIYMIYCRTTFAECRISLKRYSWTYAKPILSFSLWDLFGNFSFMVRNQGLNILVNIFFGVVLNASVAIANRVQSAFEGFAGSFLTALRPRVVKMYVQNEITQLIQTLKASCFYITIAMLILASIMSFNVDYILELWLGNVPEYTSSFVYFILLGGVIGSSVSPLAMVIQANGNIKKLSFYSGIILLLTLPFNYCFFKLGFSPVIAFSVNALSQLGRGVLFFLLVKKILVNLNVLSFVYDSYVRAFFIMLLPSLFCYFLRSFCVDMNQVGYLVCSALILTILPLITLLIVDVKFKMFALGLLRRIK